MTEKVLLENQEVKKDMDQRVKTKRYNLILPTSLFDQIELLADDESASILEMLKRFIKIGLMITTLAQSPDTKVIIREGDRERELVFL